MNYQPLDVIPMWMLYFLTVLAMLAAMEIGYRLARALRPKPLDQGSSGLDSTVGACLAVLGFLLAFMVGYGANIKTERRHLVVAEANAIGTTYLRAGYLDEPHRTQARELLREYTDLRISTRHLTRMAAVLTRSEEIQNELWAKAEKIAVQSPTPVTSLYLSSLNEVIDRHAERVAVGLNIRVPPAVLLGLYVMGLFTMFLVGIQSSDAEKRNYLARVGLVLILSVVFFLIADLDRAQQGLIRVSQQPMIDLRYQLNR